MNEKPCACCRKPVPKQRQKFCSRRCRDLARMTIPAVGDIVGNWEILSHPIVSDEMEFRCRCRGCGTVDIRVRQLIISVKRKHGCQVCYDRSRTVGSVSEFGKKRCACCGELKSSDDFTRHHTKQDKLNGRCRRCVRNSALVRYYGITIEKYEEMLDQQHFRCAICGKHAGDEVGRDLCVDHCHATGKIRGLLCRKCNWGLGWVNDDSNLLLKAVGYLKQYSTPISGT